MIRFRFPLRLIFIMTFMVAVGLIVWRKMDEAKQRRLATMRLLENGAMLSFSEEFPDSHYSRKRSQTRGHGGHPVRIAVHGTRDYLRRELIAIDRGVFEDVCRLSTLQSVSIIGTGPIQAIPVKSGDIAQLANLKHLESLELAGLPLDDSALRAISSLSGLRSLSLQNTLVTDDGLRHLARLRLRWLDLSGCRISSYGLRNLGTQDDLRVLIVNDTQVRSENAQQMFPYAYVSCIDTPERIPGWLFRMPSSKKKKDLHNLGSRGSSQ